MKHFRCRKLVKQQCCQRFRVCTTKLLSRKIETLLLKKLTSSPNSEIMKRNIKNSSKTKFGSIKNTKNHLLMISNNWISSTTVIQKSIGLKPIRGIKNLMRTISNRLKLLLKKSALSKTHLKLRNAHGKNTQMCLNPTLRPNSYKIKTQLRNKSMSFNRKKLR